MSRFSDILKSPTFLNVIDTYENIIGLKAVRAAQDSVIKAEENFLAVQENRKDVQLELVNVQARRRDISAELEKVQRGENRFIALITEEHKFIQLEKDLLAKLQLIEKSERDHFTQLSSRLRESHEKERAQSERTKYWSIAGSLAGAMVGIVGASINNYRRNQYLTQLVKNTMGHVSDVSNLANVLSQEQSQLAALIERSSPLSETINESTEKLLIGLKESQASLTALSKSVQTLYNKSSYIESKEPVLIGSGDLINELNSLNNSSANNYKLLCCLTVLTATSIIFSVFLSFK